MLTKINLIKLSTNLLNIVIHKMNSSNSYFVIMMWMVWAMWLNNTMYSESPMQKPALKPEGEIVELNGNRYIKSQNKIGEWYVTKINNRGYPE